MSFRKYLNNKEEYRNYLQVRRLLSNPKYDRYFKETEKVPDKEKKYVEIHYKQMKEVFDMLPKIYDKNKDLLFLDLCFAPGAYSKFLLDYYPTSKGHGLTLDPKDGGLEPKIDQNSRYNYKYHNIINNKFNPKHNNAFDLVLMGCHDMQLTGRLGGLLIYHSFKYAFDAAKIGGVIIFKYTIKNIDQFADFVYVLSKFTTFYFAKSKSTYGVRSTMFIVAIVNNKGEHAQNFVNYINMFRNRHFYNPPLGITESFYELLFQKLKPIFNVQIEAINNFIKKPYFMHFE